MRIEMICFSQRGLDLGNRLGGALSTQGEDVHLERGGENLRAGDWTRERFRHGRGLVFIGAVGIAVRAIAPYLVSKTRDPAVVVVDDTGKYAISLLSGHLGGANALARRIALILGAEAVITTATDRNNIFAVDEWAGRSGYAIANPKGIKGVSSALLEGREVGFASEFPVAGDPPSGLVPDAAQPALVIGTTKPAGNNALWVIPPAAVLGVGCRRGTPKAKLETFFRMFCRGSGLSPEAVVKVCSIDLKKDEAGLIEFCHGHGWPLQTFTADELKTVPGNFSASAFVKRVTGVSNVCERAAVAGSDGGSLRTTKASGEGITMSAAVKHITIDFTIREEDR